MNKNSTARQEHPRFNESEGRQAPPVSKKVLWEKDQILRACQLMNREYGDDMVLIGVAAEVIRGFRSTSPVIQFVYRAWAFPEGVALKGTLKLRDGVDLDYYVINDDPDSREPSVVVYSDAQLETIGLNDVTIRREHDVNGIDVVLADMAWNADFMGLFDSPYMDKMAKIVSGADHAYKNNFIEQKEFMLFGDIITFNELPPEAQKPLIRTALLSRIESSESSIFLKALLVDQGSS